MSARILTALAAACFAASLPGAAAAGDDGVFLRAGGCRASGDGYGFECPEGSVLAAVGCDRGMVRADLAALTPTAPIAACVEHARDGVPRHGEYLFGPRGRLPIFTRFVVVEAAGFRVLGSQEALRERFAPIEGPEEALAFAIAATGLAVLRDFERDERYRYYLEEISDTAVVAGEGAWVVRNLRHDKVFGCGPHPTSLVTVQVTRDGLVEELSRERAFEDPATDRLCVD